MTFLALNRSAPVVTASMQPAINEVARIIAEHGHKDVIVVAPGAFDRPDGVRVFAQRFWFERPARRNAFVTNEGEIIWSDEKADRLRQRNPATF